MAWWDVLNPVWDIQQLVNDGGNAVSTWLGDWGGKIGSGIESGFVFLLGDLWDVAIGPIEVFIGVVIIIVTLFWAFKDDIGQAVNMVASLAAFVK